MAEEMQGVDWIKTAVANEESKSVTVTVQEGYQYQVYYDEQTGELGAYPIGKDDGYSVPSIKVSYDKAKWEIHAEASCEDQIKVIELRHKGEVVGTKENTNIADFDVQETGWYEVRVVCAKGKVSYAKIRASNEMARPNIEVTSNNEKENDWYGKDNKEVEVTISTENETAVGIYYKTNKDTEYTHIEGKSKVLTIKEVGRTVIYAYVVDKNGNESDIANKTIQYDNIKPIIDLSKVEIKEGLQEEGSEWYKTNVVLSLDKAITDEPQEVGIDGYYVWEITNEEKPEEPLESNYLKGIDKQIRIETDGIHTLGFMAKDRAGNKSGIATLIVKKDSTKPKDFTPTIKDITNEGFTIVAGTSDETSGIAEYNFYVGGVLKGTVTEEENNKTAEYKVTGLSPNTSYLITVEAKDKAGNVKEGNSIAPVTTTGTAQEPVSIELPAVNGNNGWYKDNFNITIRSVETEATQIIYTINGVEGIINGKEGTVQVTAEGANINITAKAKAKDSEGNYTGTVTKTINKDSTDPNTATTEYVSHDIETITVKTIAQDQLSGLSTIEYQYSTDGTNYMTQTTSNYTGTTEVTTNNSYTYTGLTGNTKYWLRIKVTDMAGRVIDGTAITQTTEAGVGETELSGKVGAYVTYMPASSNPTSYSTTQDGAERSGYGAQSISKKTDLNWRVLKVDRTNNKLCLISETIPSAKVTLKGEDGYNNGVKLLNDACKTLYSNSSLGATGRSVNVEDINRLMGVTEEIKKNLNSDYGNEYTPSNKYYPNIFADEKTGAPNDKYGVLLEPSDQSSWYKGITQANILRGRYSFYRYTLRTYKETNTVEHAISTGQSNGAGTTTHDTYWLASRCTELNDNTAWFRLFCGDNGTIYANYLRASNNNDWEASNAVRPVVEIDLNYVIVGIYGDGTIGNQYSITAK